MTRRAVHLHRAADLADPTAANYDRTQLDAAEAALVAGRFNAARILAARVTARAGEGDPNALAPVRRQADVADADLADARRIERDASSGLRDGARVRERTARIFASEAATRLRTLITSGRAWLLDGLLVGAPDPGFAEATGLPTRVEGQVCPLDIVNYVLAHLGGGAGVALVADSEGRVLEVGVTPQAPAQHTGHDPASLAAALDAGGGAAPCPACGCPRFLFLQDDDAGEACPCCSWPKNPGADPVQRRRARAEELERQLADVVSERDSFKAQAETLTTLKGELEGKIKRYDRDLRRAKAGAVSTDAGAPMGVDHLAQRVEEIERRLGIKILDASGQAVDH